MSLICLLEKDDKKASLGNTYETTKCVKTGRDHDAPKECPFMGP
jgi:hypothetical protein